MLALATIKGVYGDKCGPDRTGLITKTRAKVANYLTGSVWKIFRDKVSKQDRTEHKDNISCPVFEYLSIKVRN